MASKSKITITYDDESEGVIEIASDKILTVGANIKVGDITSYKQLLAILSEVDGYIHKNGIVKIEVEEEEE